MTVSLDGFAMVYCLTEVFRLTGFANYTSCVRSSNDREQLSTSLLPSSVSCR